MPGADDDLLEPPRATAPADVHEPPRPTAPVEPFAPGPFAERLAVWRRDPRVAAVALACALLAAGVVWLRPGASPPAPGATARTDDAATVTAPGTASPVGSPSSTPARLLVHVAGAVRTPGVVELGPGARAVDAITAAGGALDDADVQQLNLAAAVADGERLVVPRVGETVASTVPAGPAGAAGPAGGDPEGPQVVDLNAATAAELETLPGIGPTLAAAIIRERERLGGFGRVEDLQRVRGIGEKRFAELRELVRV